MSGASDFTRSESSSVSHRPTWTPSSTRPRFPRCRETLPNNRRYRARVAEFTTVDDLDRDARLRAVQLIEIQTGLPAEGNEPLMACFDFALYEIASDRQCFDELRLLHPSDEQCPTC